MLNKGLVVFGLLALLEMTGINGLQGANTVVGYYPAWSRYTFPAENIDFEMLTHITHAFIWPKSNGDLDMYSSILYPALVEATHQAGKRILVSMGGWGNCTHFSAVLADSAKRQRLIDNLVSFCDEKGYDGVDLDWEYPRNTSDKNNLTRFVIALNQQLKTNDSARIVTMAVPAGAWGGQWYDFASMAPYVEWFGCMTYDFHGTWTSHAGHNAPLYAPSHETEGCADDAIRYLKSRDVPGNKIIMGVPFYGRRFNTSGLYESSTGGEALYYSEIVPKLDNDWTYHWDTLAKVPYLTNSDNSQLITYDDTVSVRCKCEYALDQGLLGIKIWHIGQDQLDGQQPLLSTIGSEILNGASISIEQTANVPIPVEMAITGIFPNPFNSSVNINYRLCHPMEIRINVYDILGRKICCLINEHRDIGLHHIQFRPDHLASGCYFIVLSNTDGLADGYKVIYLR